MQEILGTGWTTKQNEGEGDCLLLAIGLQVEENHVNLRMLIAEYIKEHAHRFHYYVLVEDGRKPEPDGSFSMQSLFAWCENFKQPRGIWGNNAAIVAAAEIYQRPIHVLHDKDGVEDLWWEFLPLDYKIHEHEIEPIRIFHMGNCHYEAVVHVS